MKKYYPTIFISDTHLGSRGCRAEAILEFLKAHKTDHLYLVGDFLDFWALRRKSYFPESHLKVIRHILKLATSGTKVTYIIGNHDEAIREFLPLALGGITCTNDAIHEANDGRRYFVIHGDIYDRVVMAAPWLAWLGDVGYTCLLRSNGAVNALQRMLGYNEWSLSRYVKSRVKGAVNFISRFEEAVTKDAADHGVDGVICGHIHTAEMRQMGDIAYINTGDWVESCTAVVEHDGGRMELIDWTGANGVSKADA